MDSDLQQLVIAWSSGSLDETAIAPVVERLRRDQAFREAFVAEIVMLGQLKAVQASEPRWLELEDMLGSRLTDSLPSEDFEQEVMRGIATTGVDGYVNETIFTGARARNKLQEWVHTPGVWLLALAAVVAGLFFWGLYGRHTSSHIPVASHHDASGEPSPGQSDSKMVPGVAVLSQSIGAEWSGERRPFAGETLRAGDLKLQSGTVQIDFFAGVRLLLRGPADIELRAPDEVRLRQGSASCFVTEMGRGFRVLTRDIEIIDRGTSFSVSVQDGQQSEVHVLKGAVEIKSPTLKSMELKENRAIRMAATGPQDVTFSPELFPQPADLQVEQRDRDQLRFEAWKNLSKQLSADPATLLHYTFEEMGPSPLELRNQASDSSRATDGVIIGCGWTEGRWPSKRALLYRNAGDRVLFQVPGDFRQLTFLTWARIDALTQTHTSVLMTEEPRRRTNLNPTGNSPPAEAIARRRASRVKSVRWELFKPTPRVSFSIAFADGDDDWQYESSHVVHAFPDQANWGKWMCLAVTCDVTNGRVIQYHNGERIGELALKHSDSLLLDFMTLGNLSVSDDELKKSAGLAQRRFFGAFDELLIAKRALSDDEIRVIWTTGQP